ncbi:MAG: sortase [Candidatus Saccharibacteria bacterium]|nr:sortase [Candidatus Saccharibacteria bacterium]
MNPSDENRTNDNPLFQQPPKKDKVVEPLHTELESNDHNNTAVTFIREKINKLYATEPSAQEELEEAEAADRHRSKHQQYMHQLSTSGKSLAEIQTAWHEYYTQLSDNEKHQVWQEFYEQHGRSDSFHPQQHSQSSTPSSQHDTQQSPAPQQNPAAKSDKRTVSDIKGQLIGRVSSRAKAPKSAHARSLMFGLGMGSLVMVFMLFGFFNERFIAPFITPSQTVSSTPIIVDDTEEISDDPLVIIPKINVEVPVVYDEPSIEEDAVQRALERGVVHYGITPNPGERGNAVIFGHSSNNILNSGKYKFAFVMLNRLKQGDTFMLHYEGTRYVYRIYEKKVVSPNDLSVLETQDRPSTVSLITCDPPGTSTNRLVVIGEQITPDPAENIASSVTPSTTSEEPPILPSNAPSLWSRIVGMLSS